MSTKDEQARDVPDESGTKLYGMKMRGGPLHTNEWRMPYIQTGPGLEEVTGWHIARFREECQKAGRELSFPVWWCMWGRSLRAPLWYRIRRWLRMACYARKP